jgi:hypothetical protein
MAKDMWIYGLTKSTWATKPNFKLGLALRCIQMNVHDYLIEQEGTDWEAIMQSWHWLLPESFTVWLVTRFADLILLFEDGSVHLLRTDSGNLDALAESKDLFLEKVDIGTNAADWLSLPLVDECVTAGMVLGKDECYAYKVLPVLGGSYDISNIYKAGIDAYLRYLSDIYKQIHDLPDGTKVRIQYGKA